MLKGFFYISEKILLKPFKQNKTFYLIKYLNSLRRRNANNSSASRLSNVHNLHDDSNENKDDNPTWNGNSTQQM